jgi:hypothetical protein
LVDIINDITGTQVDTDGSGTFTWVDTPSGRALEMNQGTDNDNGAHVWWDVSDFLTSQAFTVTLVIRTFRADNPGIMMSVGTRNHGDNNDWALRLSETQVPELFARDETTPLFIAGSTDILDPTAEDLHVITYRRLAANDHRIIVNDLQQGSATVVRTRVTAIDTVTWNTDCNISAPSGFADGAWYSGYVHDRALTTDEITLLHEDPWGFLRFAGSQRRRLQAIRHGAPGALREAMMR